MHSQTNIEFMQHTHAEKNIYLEQIMQYMLLYTKSITPTRPFLNLRTSAQIFIILYFVINNEHVQTIQFVQVLGIHELQLSQKFRFMYIYFLKLLEYINNILLLDSQFTVTTHCTNLPVDSQFHLMHSCILSLHNLRFTIFPVCTILILDSL